MGHEFFFPLNPQENWQNKFVGSKAQGLAWIKHKFSPIKGNGTTPTLKVKHVLKAWLQEST